jgi:hypothetical protein
VKEVESVEFYAWSICTTPFASHLPLNMHIEMRVMFCHFIFNEELCTNDYLRDGPIRTDVFSTTVDLAANCSSAEFTKKRYNSILIEITN